MGHGSSTVQRNGPQHRSQQLESQDPQRIEVPSLNAHPYPSIESGVVTPAANDSIAPRLLGLGLAEEDEIKPIRIGSTADNQDEKSASYGPELLSEFIRVNSNINFLQFSTEGRIFHQYQL
jgi:hypothetical protein